MSPLRQGIPEALRVRNYAPKTQQAYIDHAARFARHFGRSPDLLGAEQIRRYQLYLIEKGVSLNHIHIAFCPLCFV